jgi:uncharacterized membrane protein
MADLVFLILLILHVIFIVAWMGGAILFVSVISPGLRNMSESSGRDFVRATIPRYIRFVGGSSAIAIIVGIILYFYSVQITPSTGPSSSGLIGIQVGALLGLVALILVYAVVIPTSRRLIQVAAQAPTSNATAATSSSMTSTQDMSRLGKRIRAAGGLGVFLLLLALIMMLVGATV